MKKFNGFFGSFGGAYISEKLQKEMNKIENVYNELTEKHIKVAQPQLLLLKI